MFASPPLYCRKLGEDKAHIMRLESIEWKKDKRKDEKDEKKFGKTFKTAAAQLEDSPNNTLEEECCCRFETSYES